MKKSCLALTVLLLTMWAGITLAQTKIPISGLRGVGINSAILWSANSRQNPRNPQTVIDHFKPIERAGFSHVALVSCVDWLIGKSCKKGFQSKAGIISTIGIILANTNLHVTLSLKGYEAGKIKGKSISTFQRRLENEVKVQKDFVKLWQEFATVFKDVPASRLSFNLLNEPEFQLPKPTSRKRRAWESIASKAIIGIRKISPDRIIIFEGISKSQFNDRKGRKKPRYAFSVDTILRPLPFKNIIYGVHSYEPERFLQQAKNRAGRYGLPYSKRFRRMVKRDASRLLKWSRKHKVPVMVTETGCVSYVKNFEGPANPDDCGKYAADVYKYFVKNGVPIVWWALEKEKTIYIRERSDCGKWQKKYCDTWVPKGKRPDPFLFQALRLNAN